MLPTGASGKNYIDETTLLFHLWVNNTPYETVNVMPALLLKKTKQIFQIERKSIIMVIMF